MLEKFEQKTRRALKWSERFTKTDMTYLAGGTFWLGIGNIITIISGLIISVAFANLLPKEAFGTYQFVLSLAAVVSALTLTGMKPAILKEIAKGVEGAFWYGFVTHLKWSIGIALGGLALAGYYFVNDNVVLATSFLIVGALAPFLESFKLYQQFFLGKKDFRSSVLFGAWRKPVPIIALLTALFLTNNPAIIVLVYFLAHTATTSILFWHMMRKYKPERSAPGKHVLNHAKHFTFLQAVGTIADNLDKVLLFHYIGAAEVAIYSFAKMPQSRLGNLTGIIKTLTFPKISENSIATIKKTLPRQLVLLFFVILVVVVAYIIAAPLIFRLLFPQYMDSVFFSQVLSLLLLFAPIGILKQVFITHVNTFKKEMYIVGVSEKIMKITLLLILLPLYGIWGAILALFLTRAVNNIAAIYFFITAKQST